MNTDFIRAQDKIDEVAGRYPAAQRVLEAKGLRQEPWSSTIRKAAWRKGVELSGLLEELNQAAESDAAYG